MTSLEICLAPSLPVPVAPPWDQAIVTLEAPTRHGAQPLRICLAHDDSQARAARYFVEQRYGEMGYECTSAPAQPRRPTRATLLAYEGPRVVGTLTLGFDVGRGLVADEQYGHEVDGLRGRGGAVAEITKLALDTKVSSKRLLAALFNVGYLYLRKIWRCTDLVIEVTPAHAAFYTRSLQFRQIGAPCICPRVNVEGVLLWLDLLETQRTVAQVAGLGGPTRDNRTLYAHFFAQAQEARVTERLRQAEPGVGLRGTR
jgi:hypothetical protein